MTSRVWLGGLVMVSVLSVACGPQRRADVDPVDAGFTEDAGDVADAGSSDAGLIEDAGEPDAGEVEGCGSVTASGECRGNDAVWCDDGELIELPCDNALNTGIEGTCTVAGSFGSWCAVGQGRQCAFERPGSRALTLFVCGPGSGLACDVDDGCISGGAACVPPAAGQSFATSCMGSRLVVGCSEWGQKVTQSCLGSDIGGTGCSAGACTGIPAGRTCDGVRKCATGLTCTDNVCRDPAAAASLAVSVIGGGRVVSSPPAIDCPGACGATGDEGVEVTLTATASEGWRFESWSGACSGTSPTASLTMSGSKTCTATFVRSTFYLNVYLNSAGSVTSEPSGIDCPGTCAAGYAPGTEVTLTAKAPDGHRFSKWQGCSTATSESITVTMDEDRSCSPVFEQVAEVSVAVTGPGRVTSTPAGLDCPETCSALFVPNRTITLTQTPDPESRFVGWGGRCSGTGVNANLYVSSGGGNACTATFEAIPRHVLTVSIAGEGEVESTPGDIVCPGNCSDDFVDQGSVTLTATASPGHRFARWRDLSEPAGNDCQGTTPTTTVKLTRARHCRAEFVKEVSVSLAWRHGAPAQYSSYVAWRPDGGAVAFSGNASAQLFDATTSAFLGSFAAANPHTVVWSPDGGTLAAAVLTSSNQRVTLHDVNTGAVRYLPASGYVTTGQITSLAWSPDGLRLATADSLGAVKIWNVATAQPLMNWNPSTVEGTHVSGLAWSPDGALLATTFNSSSEGVKLWETVDWTLAKDFPGPSSSRVAWSADASFLIGARHSDIFVWEVDGNVRSFEVNSCLDASVDPAGSRLVARCQGQTTIWEVSSGTKLFTASLPQGATAFDVRWSPVSSLIAVGGYDGSAWIVDADTGKVVRSFGGPWGSVTELAMHPDGDELFGVSYDGVVYALDASTGAHVRNLTTTRFDAFTRPNSLTVSPDGEVLAVGAGSYVYTWKTADGVEHAPRFYAGSTVIQLRWSLANVLATSLYGDNGIKLWPSGVAPASATLQRSDPAYQASPEIAWHPAGRYLASAGRNDTQLWDRMTNLPTRTLSCPVVGGTPGTAESTAFSADGERLASTCSNGLQVWDWSEGAEVVRVPSSGATRLAWRPGDESMAVVVNGHVQLFEAATGNTMLVSPVDTEGSATDVIWSADGKTLIVGTSAGRIEAYSVSQ